MAQRGGNEHAVKGHLRDARAEVVAVLSDIVSEPGGEQFLDTREHTGGEHLGAQRVVLQLLEVGLRSTFFGSAWRSSIGRRILRIEIQRVIYIPQGIQSGSFHRSIALRRGEPSPQAYHQRSRPRERSPLGI